MHGRWRSQQYEEGYLVSSQGDRWRPLAGVGSSLESEHHAPATTVSFHRTSTNDMLVCSGIAAE